MDDKIRKLLRGYLTAYWLRPETVLWRTCNYLNTQNFKFERPSLDFACGDGLNSYIRLGNDLPLEIDDSLSVISVTPKEFFEDYVDIYNDTAKDFKQLPEAKFKMDIGLDWKKELIDKAKKLNFYEDLIVRDGNKPLPFKDETFKSIFSNSLYWMENTDGILKEFFRVLKPKGKIYLLLLNPHYHKYNIYKRFKTKWSKTFDRGRRFHHKSLFTDKVWEKKFKETGFKIIKKKSHLHPKLIQIHEIGFRPISPVLIEMANSLSPSKRNEIKKKWIDYLEYIIMPFFEEKYFMNWHRNNVCYAYELEKT